jgi:predicted Zn-dependent protease
VRKQYVAEQLSARLERLHPSGVVIGVTRQDMWMATKSYRFVFAIRDSRAAVVSTARMDPAFFAAIPDRELFYSRIEKITIKEIAMWVPEIQIERRSERLVIH